MTRISYFDNNATTHNKTCNSENMGLSDITRTHTQTRPIYVILFMSSRGGNNASNARTYTAYSQGSSTTTRYLAQYGKETYRAERITSHHGWRTYKGQAKRDRSLSQQEHHNRRQIKKAGTFQLINNVMAAQPLPIIVQTLSSGLSSRYLFTHCTQCKQKLQGYQSSKRWWWRCMYE